MSSWRQQALIEAPLEDVWKLIGNPNRYPEWAAEVLEITGLASVDEGQTFQQVTKTPISKDQTTFEIEELDELHEIKLRCQTSGFYSRWLLTEARENTFLDVEIGMDPATVPYRVMNATVGKRWYRRLVENSLDGLRNVVERSR